MVSFHSPVVINQDGHAHISSTECCKLGWPWSHFHLLIVINWDGHAHISSTECCKLGWPWSHFHLLNVINWDGHGHISSTKCHKNVWNAFSRYHFDANLTNFLLLPQYSPLAAIHTNNYIIFRIAFFNDKLFFQRTIFR